jgi:cytochrome P450
VQPGEGVIISLLAANHDPAEFPDPERLDPGRFGPAPSDRAQPGRRHVAFGYGPHQCLGQSLARAELDIVYRTLFTRVPGLRLAVPLADLPLKDDGFVFGLYELPVSW